MQPNREDLDAEIWAGVAEAETEIAQGEWVSEDDLHARLRLSLNNYRHE